MSSFVWLFQVAFDTDGLVLLTSVIDDTNNPTWDQYLYFGYEAHKYDMISLVEFGLPTWLFPLDI